MIMREAIVSPMPSGDAAGSKMCGDPSSDRDDTLDDHPANREALGKTGLLDESSRRANLHGDAVKVAPNIKLATRSAY